jgi:hypothetical protein
VFGNAPEPFSEKRGRFAPVIVTGGLILAALGLFASLVRGGTALAVITLSVLWIVRLAIVHRGRPSRLDTAQETTLLLAALLILYLGNGRTLASGDTMPARYLPLILLRERTFYLDRLEFLYAQCLPYYLAPAGDHYVSAYPVAAALSALPIYLPAALAGIPLDSPVLTELEKLAAATIVALSAILLYRGVRWVGSRRAALLATAAYALGSSSFSVSSQALWQHGPSQLGLVATLYCLLRGQHQPSWVGFAGFPLAFAVIARPPDALIALCLAAYVLLQRPRQLPVFTLAALPPVLFQLWYNVRYLGDPFKTQWALLDSGIWTTPFWEGIAGLTLSPGRGLLVYSPIFALSTVGFALAWRRGGDALLRALGVAACLTLVHYAKWEMWWGGSTFGPRLLADLSPALALGLVPWDGLLQRHRALAFTGAVLLGWSIFAHAVGVYAHDYAWNAYADVDRTPGRLWSWTDNQLVNPPRRALARASLMLAGVPTSRSSPELLAATYSVRAAPGQNVPPRSRLELSLTAVNTGHAAWLAWPRDGYGVVTLGWRWRQTVEVAPSAGGAQRLYHDVPPGGSAQFQLHLDSPSTPGSYLLEIGLACNATGCAAPIASPVLQLEVTVGEPGVSSESPAGPSPRRERCRPQPFAVEKLTPCPGIR